MRYSVNPRFFDVVDLNNTLEYNLPDIVKVSGTIEDIRLKSSLKIIQTLNFTEKSFFYTILGFTRSRYSNLDDIEKFYQLIAASYKGDRPTNITGFDKVHLKFDCIDGSFFKGIRGPILYSFGLS